VSSNPNGAHKSDPACSDQLMQCFKNSGKVMLKSRQLAFLNLGDFNEQQCLSFSQAWDGDRTKSSLLCSASAEKLGWEPWEAGLQV
jgi:hypothetical protein